MDNTVLEKIKEYAQNELTKAYGFCGVATGKESAMLNSSDRNGNDIKITISSVPE